MATRGVRRAVESSVPFVFDDAALESALQYLLDLGLIRFQWDPLGAGKWWNATTPGLQLLERGGI